MREEKDLNLQAAALRLLDRLERREMELLAWGCVDGFFSDNEFYEEAEHSIESAELGDDLDADELLDWLLDNGWLWRLPTRAGGYRTRFAEAVRLMSRLRQIRDWNGEITDDAWRTAPALVADYRLALRPRTFPLRNRDLETELAPLTSENWRRGPNGGRILDALRTIVADEDKKPRPLAGFQFRATTRILSAVDAAKRQTTGPTGTVICAGTGSGKTLAFYLPALAEIAARIDSSHWVKALAVYPRNELLKDQLREALVNGRKVQSALKRDGRRPIAFASLTGLTPNDGSAVERGYSPWQPATLEGDVRGPARICPFVRCVDCNGEIAWLDEERRRGEERLRCLTPGCGGTIEHEELRLTRASMLSSLPDVLFVSTEMMNRRMSSTPYAALLGLGRRREERPVFMLLDEIHDYEGTRGAHTAMLIRRWRHEVRAPIHFVGLSATLEDAERFFADLVGLKPSSVRLIEPDPEEMDARGAEYLIALRGDPSSGAGLLSTTIQTVMLTRRLLGTTPDDEVAGSRAFVFADDLDVINRLYFNVLDAEGLDKRQRPTSRRPLAYHRGTARPMPSERLDEGQNWGLCEKIGHNLGTPVQVGRTSSQDQGVQANAEIIIATTSLEVGFDDPTVGAVVQHKAPPGAARFLQRKGRAGRGRSMRPWTAIVLSDFGRDRIQYQAYEQLFSPILAPRYLPLGNRTMLRMQATYALFSWLARSPGRLVLEPWSDLAAPMGDASRAKERRAHYQDRLTRLLEDPSEQEQLRGFLGAALALPEAEVDALLWEPPRAVLLEAVPTLLRRLESGWTRAFDSGLEPQRKYGPPIPEFVQSTLFGELLTPEVEVVNVGREHHERLDEMKIVQAISEFSPGRVSRRFGIHTDWGHWVDPGDGGTLDIGRFCPAGAREVVRVARYIEDGVSVDIPIVRPSSVWVLPPPKEVSPSSNARPLWRVQVVAAEGEPHVIDPPAGTPWSDLFRPLVFQTHHLGAPVELRRFSIGSRYSLIRNGHREQEKTLSFVTSTEGEGARPVALGYAADVDGVHFRYREPARLNEIATANASLRRSLKPQFFRDLVCSDRRLDGLLNRFQREQLSESFLTTVGVVAAAQDLSIAEAIDAITEAPEQLEQVIELVALWTEEEADAEPMSEAVRELPGRRVPKRVRELVSSLAEAIVRDVLAEHAHGLVAPKGLRWERWLRERFRATLAAATRQAILAMCPRTDPDSLIAELGDGHESQPGEAAFWMLETVLGGAGALESFHEAYSRDPRRFFRLLEAELAPKDREAVALSLDSILKRITEDPSSDLARAFTAMRGAESHEERRKANIELRAHLGEAGIVADPSLLVSLHARLLGPGTNPTSDLFVASLIERWDNLEEGLGCELDSVAMAAIESQNEGLEDALGLQPPDLDTARTWRYSMLRGLLWARGGFLREQSLQVGNRFEESPSCDRLLVASVVGTAVQTVRIEDGSQWFEDVKDALDRGGTCDLVVGPEERSLLADALLRVATNRLETEGLRVHARVVGLGRTSEGWSARLELPEAYQ